MQSLPLSPFPSLRLEKSRSGSASQPQDFVDDAVILALLDGPASSRKSPEPLDLALSQDEMDFAGWRLSAALPSRSTAAVVRRPSPPVCTESGLGEPHRGSHRWWLAGLAGALTTLIFTSLLFSLASRGVAPDEAWISIQPPVKQPAQPADPKDGKADAPQLSDASPIR